MGKLKQGKYSCVVAVLCGLAASSVGLCINSVGVFYAPVAEDLGILRGSFSMHVTIASIVTAVAALFAPRWMKDRTFKPILTAGVLLSGISTCLMACSSAMPAFYLLGTLRGIGNAAYGMVMLTVIVNRWFEARHGLATSIVLSFGGIAGAVCSPLLTAVIEKAGWRTGYIVMGILMIVFCIPAILYPFSISPEAEGRKPYGAGQGAPEGKENMEKVDAQKFHYLSIPFAAMLLVGVLHTAITCLPQHFPGFSQSIGSTAAVGAMMLSFCMAGNILSKLLIGMLADRWSSMKATVFMIGLHLLSIIMLLAFRSEILLCGAAFLFGFVYSVSAVGLVLITKDCFGAENYAKAYPVISFAGGVSCAVGMSLVGYLFDFTGSYQAAFLAAALFHVIDLGLLSLMKRKTGKKKRLVPSRQRTCDGWEP